MSDWPDAVREWERYRDNAMENRPPGYWDDTFGMADAAIAALKEMVERLGHTGLCRICGEPCQTVGDVLPDLWLCAKCGREAYGHLVELKCAAEAEVERLKWMLTTVLEESRGTWTHLGTHDVIADLAARYEKEEK